MRFFESSKPWHSRLVGESRPQFCINRGKGRRRHGIREEIRPEVISSEKWGGVSCGKMPGGTL